MREQYAHGQIYEELDGVKFVSRSGHRVKRIETREFLAWKGNQLFFSFEISGHGNAFVHRLFKTVRIERRSKRDNLPRNRNIELVPWLEGE